MTTMTLRAESTAKSLRSSSPTWRADKDCGSTRSSGTPLDAKERRPKDQQQRDDRDAHGIARRITNFVERYQKFCSIGLRTGSGLLKTQRARARPASPAGRQAARSLRAPPRSRDGRERHHRDARIGERLQKYIGNNTIATIDSATSSPRTNGAARGRHGAAQRAVAVGTVGDLVAVSADDQQRVVDGQGQTHRDGQVHREDRHVGDQGDGPQHGHRPRIANPPTASGSAAAIRPPNTQTSTTKLSGIAIDSIVNRSFSL